jgi:hypothetical protein
MSEAAFSEARRVFEILPGAGSLECAIGKLASAGVERQRIHAWAVSIAEEFGVLSYVRNTLNRFKSQSKGA